MTVGIQKTYLVQIVKVSSVFDDQVYALLNEPSFP